jgi:hypothetical protein
MEAGQKLFENNPMSAVCAIVCNHEKQCAGSCIRGIKDTPVHFSSIEQYISDMYLDRMTVERPAKKGKKAAVIGCGPAGMTVAIKLAQAGYPVTVFECKGKIGGLLQYGIPEFRLPKSFLDRYQARMEEMGITIRTNTTIGSVLMIDELIRDGYSSIFIGTGAWKQPILGITGEEMTQFGLNFLVEVNKYLKKVASFGENILVCRLIEGIYPAYRSVFPKNNTNRMTIARTDLLGVVKRIAVCSNQVSNQIKLKLSFNEVLVSAQDLSFSMSAHETLPCQYDGEAMEIGFKSTFLLEILNNLPYQNITLELADPSRAALIVSADEANPDENIRALLMPVMING